VLVERKLKVNREFYVGITINRSTGTPTVIASASGGVDIEEVAAKSPEKVVKLNVDLIMGLQEHEANYLMKKIGLTGKNMLTASRIMQKLYKVFRSYDAELTEINPLVLTATGELVAADGRLNIDDSAVYRHPEFKEQEDRELTELERRAKDADLSYLELDGEIGIIGNGAGLVMATLDSVKLHGGSPANFCDLGGGAPRERVIEGIDILLTNPKVKAVLINIMGGITRCDDVATGLVEYRDRKDITIPIVVRMVGTNEKKSREICRRAGICLLDTMDEAVEKVVEFVRGS